MAIMSGVQKRLHIGDVPVSVSEEQLKDVIGKYGAVSSIELKKKVNIDTGSKSRTFAYADVVFVSEESLNHVLSLAANGSVRVTDVPIRVQVAKEHFLSRLQRERCSDGRETHAADHVNDRYNHSHHQNNNHHHHHQQPKPQDKQFSERRRQQESVAAKRIVFQRLESLSELEVRSDNGTEPKAGKTQQELDDEKRLSSLMSVQQEKARQKQLIRDSLNNQSKNRKIIFDTETPVSGTNGNSKSGKNMTATPKTPLFREKDDDDNDDEDGDRTLDDVLSRSAKQGKQMQDLQSKFANDPRFQVSSSFVDEDSEDKDGDEDDGNGTGVREKTRNLDILESLLNKPFMPSEAKPPAKPLLVPRFDPSSKSAAEFEVKRKAESNEKEETKSKKQKQKNGAKKEKEKNKKKAEIRGPAETSKERFYAMDKSLSQELRVKNQSHDEGKATTGTFKFSDLFSRNDDEDDDVPSLPVVDFWSRKEESKQTKEKNRVNSDTGKAVESVTAVIPVERDLFTEHFFIQKQDKRLDEDPFFDPKRIQQIKKSLGKQVIASMDHTLAMKNKACKNRRAGRPVVQFSKDKNPAEGEDDVLMQGKRGKFLKKGDKKEKKVKDLRTKVKNRLKGSSVAVANNKSKRK